MAPRDPTGAEDPLLRAFRQRVRETMARDLERERAEAEALRSEVLPSQLPAIALAGFLRFSFLARCHHGPTSTIDFLKRALDHLEEAQAGLFAASDRHLLTPEILTGARKDLFEIREGILKLIEEFRRHD